jgi:hypothetical protein
MAPQQAMMVQEKPTRSAQQSKGRAVRDVEALFGLENLAAHPQTNRRLS